MKMPITQFIKQGIVLALLLVFNLGIEPFPDNDPLNKGQAEIPNMSGFGNPGVGFLPGISSPNRISAFNPQLTDAYNEPHPFPEYLKRFGLEGNFPKYYRQLLNTAPVDNVQSQVFDQEEFKKVRRIVIQEFENKTYSPNRDETAGRIITSQVYQELRNSNQYAVQSSSADGDEGFRMKISTDFSSVKTGQKSKSSDQEQEFSQETTPKEYDAIMIGAVTKFLDHYIDRHGKRRKSISGGVEFGSYLISAKDGKVIWGARYVINQNPELTNLFRNEGRWLTKAELSRKGMKQVLKAFYENKPVP